MIDSLNWKEGVKILSVCGVIVLLSLMFPAKRTGVTKAKAGSIWTENDLFAQADFNVYKTSEQIATETSELRSKILPIFVENPSVRNVALDGLVSNLSSKINEVNDNQSYFKNRIKTVYDRGIIDQTIDTDRLEIERTGQKVQSSIDRVYTLETAAEFVKKELDKLGVAPGAVGGNEIERFLQPSLIYNATAYNEKLKLAINNIPKTESIVKNGELIVSKGEEVDAYTERKISAYDQHLSANDKLKENNLWTFIGYLLLTCLIMLALIFYLKKYFPHIDDKLSGLFFILLWPLLFGFLVYMVEKSPSLSPYILPFCIVPIIVKNFYPGRLALFMHVVVILIASILSSQGYEFTFLQVLAGIITVLVVSETRLWNSFFIAILIIFATYAVGYLGLALIQEGSLSSIDSSMFLWLALNAVLLMLAYPFIPLIEKIFGFTSSISLVELSEMSNPLLKELSIKAPGTMQHSLQVANLAEAAADKIGANSLLVKTAALYHDIGKTLQPKYFIENAGADQNMHDELNNNFASAKIILDHVIEGEKMAKKARLPKVITDFITTHHGTTRVEYFYRKQKELDPAHNFDESLFRYPGPNPVSKEQSILMCADSIEAAAKSLTAPTGNDIDQLVDGIIKHKIEQKQFDQSELSFSELETCVEVFKSLLRSIYHVRVEYPEEK